MPTQPANPRLASLVFRMSRRRLDALRELSRTTRIRQSEYLREALSDLLGKHAAGPAINLGEQTAR